MAAGGFDDRAARERVVQGDFVRAAGEGFGDELARRDVGAREPGLEERGGADARVEALDLADGFVGEALDDGARGQPVFADEADDRRGECRVGGGLVALHLDVEQRGARAAALEDLRERGDALAGEALSGEGGGAEVEPGSGVRVEQLGGGERFDASGSERGALERGVVDDEGDSVA